MVERRQVVDVPPARMFVREHHSEQKQCTQCQQITVGPFSPEVRAPVQYGPRIAAMAVYLVQQQLLPLARTCEVMEDLLAVSMSEGTLCDLIWLIKMISWILHILKHNPLQVVESAITSWAKSTGLMLVMHI